MFEKFLIVKKDLILKDGFTFLRELYLPLIGYKAAFLYDNLVNLSETVNEEIEVSNFLYFIGMSEQDFILAKRTLESVELVQTFENGGEITIALCGVKTPSDFFNDTILFELFKNRVNDDYYKSIVNKYSNKFDTTNLKNVSASITDSFQINFDPSNTTFKKGSFVTVNKNQVRGNIDSNEFFRYLKTKSTFTRENFSDEEVNKIFSLANTYNVDLKTLGKLVTNAYEPDSTIKKGGKVNFTYLEKQLRMSKLVFTSKSTAKKNNKKITINSETELANKLLKYQNTSIFDFLRELQGGIAPINSDLGLMNRIKDQFGFSDGVVNVLIDFCITKYDGKLNNTLVEKIAASMVREHIDDVLKAYNYLYLGNVKNKKEEVKKTETKPVEKEKIKTLTSDSDDEYFDDFEDLI